MIGVSVVSCSDLPVADVLSSDPYVKVYGRDEHQKFYRAGRTETVKKNLNPVFQPNQYKIAQERAKTLYFQIMDSDGAKDDIMGFAEISLEDALAKNEQEFEIPITQDGDIRKPTENARIKVKVVKVGNHPIGAFLKDKAHTLWLRMDTLEDNIDATLDFLIVDTKNKKAAYTDQDDGVPSFIELSADKETGNKQIRINISKKIKDGEYVIVPLIRTRARFAPQKIGVSILFGPKLETKTRDGIKFYICDDEETSRLVKMSDIGVDFKYRGATFSNGALVIKDGSAHIEQFKQVNRLSYSADQMVKHFPPGIFPEGEYKVGF